MSKKKDKSKKGVMFFVIGLALLFFSTIISLANAIGFILFLSGAVLLILSSISYNFN